MIKTIILLCVTLGISLSVSASDFVLRSRSEVRAAIIDFVSTSTYGKSKPSQGMTYDRDNFLRALEQNLKSIPRAKAIEAIDNHYLRALIEVATLGCDMKLKNSPVSTPLSEEEVAALLDEAWPSVSDTRTSKMIYEKAKSASTVLQQYKIACILAFSAPRFYLIPTSVE